MSQQEVRELRALAPDALQKELDQAHEALFRLRFQAQTRQLADNSQVRKSRRRVALIKTLLQERSADAAGAAAAE